MADYTKKVHESDSIHFCDGHLKFLKLTSDTNSEIKSSYSRQLEFITTLNFKIH